MTSPQGRRLRLALAAALSCILLVSTPAGAARSSSSADAPDRRQAEVLVLQTSTAATRVQVNIAPGMDLGRSCQGPVGACNRRVYYPCFNPQDPFYEACRLYTLYQVVHSDDAGVIGPLTIRGADQTRSGEILLHHWARKTTEVALEVYARDAAREYGHARLTVRSFPEDLGVAARSEPIGHLPLPRRGAPDAGWIVGTARHGKKPMPPVSFKFDAFGHHNTHHAAGLLGEGTTLGGFGSARVEPGERAGRFQSRPMWVGTYDLHIQRRGGSFSCSFHLRPGANTLNLDFSAPRLGNSRCKPLRPLAQGVPG